MGVAEGVAGPGADLDRGGFHFPPRSVPGKGSCGHRGPWPCQRLWCPPPPNKHIRPAPSGHARAECPGTNDQHPAPPHPRAAEPITLTEARFTSNANDGLLCPDSVCAKVIFSIPFFLYDSRSAGTEPLVPPPSWRRDAPGLFSTFLKSRP